MIKSSKHQDQLTSLFPVLDPFPLSYHQICPYEKAKIDISLKL